MGTRPRTLALLALLALFVGACTTATEESPTSTADSVTSTTLPPATTTTTQPDPCADVFCLVYHINPDATWSDGVPVTANDFLFTYETITDPINGRPDPVGYELITNVAMVDAKTVIFSFSAVYGPWQTLFDTVLPAHVMTDDFDPELAYTTTATRYLLDDWVPADRAKLRAVGNFWSETEPISGAPIGDVHQIEFVFSRSVRDALAGLDDDEFQYLTIRPLDWMVEELAEADSVDHEVGSGHFWEHIDFNHDDPLLSQSWVREVFNLAIDRQAILDATVRTVDPEAPALNNTVWMTNAATYESHYADRFDPEAAESLLQEHFCERGDGDIYSCQGRNMSFRLATTVGDEFRETQVEMIQEHLAAVGIEVVPEFMTPSRLFSAPVFFGGPEVWQLISFSWKAGADPYLGDTTYHCEGEAPNGFGALNVNRYCNETVDTLIRSTGSIADRQARVDVYNQVDDLYLSDLAMIPLYQKPDLAAWRSSIDGPQLNLSDSTNLWNIAAWTGADSVAIPLQTEPTLPNPILSPDDDVAIVLAPLLTGAFEVTPDLQYVPVLVESVELIVSEP